MMNKLLFSLIFCGACFVAGAQQKPNVIVILADDLGYGDVSSYGATKLHTPNIDRLAQSGLRFTNAHTTSATCTPSRYALLTGQYPWRKAGTDILPGDAALIIPTNITTLPKLFQRAGYATAIVGKWHLGLGNSVTKNWNEEIKPGPNEVGFDYSFIFPATADRVPTVFLQDRHVVALDTADPIQVDYQQPVGSDPTGKEQPELLKMKSSPNHGHNNTIVNGIGRIGYMKGGHTARWTDEEMPFTFLSKAKTFLEAHKSKPFFLYYALTEPHVPRMPGTMFKGKSGLGFRGDAILQLDWAVGELLKEVEALGLAKNTLIIFSSDNGPVLDDGYVDGAVTQLNGHRPAGPLRGGKYSAFEAGTRVPFLISWPQAIRPGVSSALVSQVDLLTSFSRLLNQSLPAGEAPDSEDLLGVFLGKTQKGRTLLIEHAGDAKNGSDTATALNTAFPPLTKSACILSLVRGDWKYIYPSDRPASNQLTGTETGSAPVPQLYNLKQDIGEKENVAAQYPEIVQEMEALLKKEVAGK
ncbi:arylsulfatase [Paraflavisolibacter sp. H34]|uniref:sulfatase family protein n=1 Tax=Huijunlia imazamoxiresistens TaxID=3127457 RepID=UPI003018BD11